MYADAARAFAEDRFPAAKRGFEDARGPLQAAGSPFAVRALIELGGLAHVTGQADDAVTLLNRGLNIARERGHSFAAARSTWFLGLTAFNRGRLDEVRRRYEETLSIFERMGDVEQSAAVHNLLAAYHGYLGDEATAWTHRQTALAGLAVTRSERFRYMVLVATAAAVRRQSAETALAFQDALVDSAKTSGRQAAVVEALSQRASLLDELGRNAEARTELTAARAWLQGTPDLALRQRAEEPILAAESDVYAADEPQRAVAAAELALARVAERGDRLRIAQLSLKLAKANIVWGRTAQAEAALGRGIKAFDEERTSAGDEGRVSTLDESWQLFDTAVQLAIRNKNYPLAFAMSERARTRTLAEQNRATAGRTLAEVEQALGPDEAVVALNQFDRELAVWVIRQGVTTVVTRPLTRLNARRLVARQQDEIRHEASVADAGADLFNEILRPVARSLSGVTRLSVVPDATYEDTSFAALWDASNRRFVAEQMILTTASSISAAAQPRLDRIAGQPTDSLILGGPDATAQALTIAGVYREPVVLTGSAATRSRFMADASSRSIIHVAASARSNRAFPLLSRLTLSDEPGRRYSGEVLGRDIVTRPLTRTRLVSIDADGATNNGGSRDLARAFMAAGVPAVLGTLPGADEAATRPLMVGFHRLMSTGIPADEALNTLQRNVLQSNGRRLGAWCALVLYGSDR
jgi:CHAT domain-containing protein